MSFILKCCFGHVLPPRLFIRASFANQRELPLLQLFERFRLLPRKWLFRRKGVAVSPFAAVAYDLSYGCVCFLGRIAGVKNRL